ncbi:phage virion morphogenesis protein [Xenorhabdus nematophila]|uniref:Phage tail protein S n=1 Tax=Xenorhabdus nematophila (strain ATCC 19061 / DSM 3370 / CCUG 14189 / LMG 1036 / NCIMB 9965 / AN6) TaxID=406817 RepID=D3VKL6_XENNA|nr:phage virion morphogenesis protein [Xenorhabdus nematophila]CBJ91124.1 putative phage tail protein S [Xenorhabdus nematophila ATCC 19061]CEK23946.1 putative phage tail protein S [Xenorhabdus nematophila AN6/1]
MDNDELQPLDTALTALLTQLSPASRKQLSRDIARDLRRSQMQRIRAQRNPDGSRYTQRKAKVLTVQRGMKFVWRGETRTLKNWQIRKGKNGKVITGYDADRKGVRTFYRDDIQRILEKKSDRLTTRKTSAKTRMFKKLATARYLRLSATDREAVIFFAPKAAAVARVHQFGLKERMHGKNIEVHYPARRLLGLTTQDIQHIEEQILAHLTR